MIIEGMGAALPKGPGENTALAIKFGESVIRVYWRILNLVIASASA